MLVADSFSFFFLLRLWLLYKKYKLEALYAFVLFREQPDKKACPLLAFCKEHLLCVCVEAAVSLQRFNPPSSKVKSSPISRENDLH